MQTGHREFPFRNCKLFLTAAIKITGWPYGTVHLARENKGFANCHTLSQTFTAWSHADF